MAAFGYLPRLFRTVLSAPADHFTKVVEAGEALREAEDTGPGTVRLSARCPGGGAVGAPPAVGSRYTTQRRFEGVAAFLTIKVEFSPTSFGYLPRLLRTVLSAPAGHFSSVVEASEALLEAEGTGPGTIRLSARFPART